MTAKQYLSQLKRLDMMIDQKLKAITDLREKATALESLDYSKEPVQTSPPPDARYAEIIQKLADISLEIDRDIDQFADLKQTIIEQIQSLDDQRYVELLFKHYVEGKHFDKIAAEMTYVYRYTIQLHSEALKAFETTYPNLPKNVI